MNSPSPELQALQREQTRLRVRLAIVLVSTICAFALFLSWLAQDNPLQPLLLVKVSFIGLAVVYVVGAGIAAIYARWISSRREPVLRAHQRAANKEHQ
jgi:hypothetical protein